MSAQSIGGRGMGSYVEDGATRQPFEANLMDFRHSVVQAHKRADAGDESLEICAHCMCEVDVDPQPHRPGCPGIGGARATSSPVLAGLDPMHHSPAPRPAVVLGSARNGLDALERMDDGLPQEPELEPDVDDAPDDEEVLEEQEPEVSVEPASASPAIEPPVAPSRSSSTRRGGWTRETMIAAIQSFVAGNGHPPAHAHLTGNRLLPSAPAATRLFGSFGALVEAAGFDRPTRGTRYAKDSSSERAASQPAARGHARPGAGGGLDDEPPALGARSPEATADGSGEPVTGPPAPDPVTERTLAEGAPERLGPDAAPSAGARDLTAVHLAALNLVNAVFDLLEARNA